MKHILTGWIIYLNFEDGETVHNTRVIHATRSTVAKFSFYIYCFKFRKHKKVCVEKEKLKQMVESLHKQVERKDKFMFKVEHEFMLLSSKLRSKTCTSQLATWTSSKLEQIMVEMPAHEDEFKKLKDNLENVLGNFEKEKQNEVLESIMIYVEIMLETVECRLINSVDCCAYRGG
jgi:hypothetical protein